MKNFKALLVVILLFTAFQTKAQNNNATSDKFAQFIVTNIESWEEARKIDEFMRSQSGIVMSRQDVPSKRYFCFFDPNSEISKATFEEWFAEMGFEVKCYVEGVRGTDPFPNHSYHNCDE